MQTQANNVLIMVGPPCSGKSTLIKERYQDHFIISSDNIVEQVCEKNGLTYSQFFELDFNHTIRQGQRTLFEQSIEESKNHQNIVWDLTNLTKRDRAKAMSHYSNAIFRAIECAFKGWEKDIIKACHGRANNTGKLIPEGVLWNMFKRYEPVTRKEGFKEVFTVNLINDFNKKHGSSS